MVAGQDGPNAKASLLWAGRPRVWSQRGGRDARKSWWDQSQHTHLHGARWRRARASERQEDCDESRPGQTLMCWLYFIPVIACAARHDMWARLGLAKEYARAEQANRRLGPFGSGARRGRQSRVSDVPPTSEEREREREREKGKEGKTDVTT